MIDHQLFAILTGLFLALVGHHLTIGRDRRREFNEIAIPLRTKIRREAEQPSAQCIAISRDEADAIASRLWWFQRDSFLQHCDKYWNAHKQQHRDELGQPTLDVPYDVAANLEALLHYIKLR